MLCAGVAFVVSGPVISCLFVVVGCWVHVVPPCCDIYVVLSWLFVFGFVSPSRFGIYFMSSFVLYFLCSLSIVLV